MFKTPEELWGVDEGGARKTYPLSFDPKALANGDSQVMLDFDAPKKTELILMVGLPACMSTSLSPS